MFRLAFLNLNRRKLRVFLLSLTVVITTSFLVAIMILGNSLLAAIEASESKDLIETLFTKEFVTFVKNTLLSFTILALLIGGFVIKNTFTVILTQRAKELALIRIIGASKSQIFQLVIWEALLIGLAGSIIGILAGTGLAQLALSVAEAFSYEVPNVGLRFSSGVFILPIILGVSITLISAIIPAWKASRQTPLKVLTGVENIIKKTPVIRLVAGSILSSLGFLIAIAMIATGLNPIDSAGDAAFDFGVVLPLRIFTLFAGFGILAIGLTVLSPVIAKLFAGLQIRILKRSRFVGWRLSAGNIWRQPLRSAATANVLMIGITLITTITIILGSFRSTTIYFVNELFPVDWIVQAKSESFFEGGLEFAPDPKVESEVYNEIKAYSNEIEVIGVRYSYNHVQLKPGNEELTDKPILDTPDDLGNSPPTDTNTLKLNNLAGVDVGEHLRERFNLDLEDDELANLQAGQIIVSQDPFSTINFSAPNLQIGEEVTLTYWDRIEAEVLESDFNSDQVFDIEDILEQVGEQTFIVGGFFERPFDGMDFILSNEAYETFTKQTNYTYITVNNSSPLSDAEVRESLEGIIAVNEDLKIEGQEDIVKQINDVFSIILNVFRGLLSLSFIVALAGIFNTLILSVFERTREIGLLRAIGSSRKLIRRMISMEAIQIASLGVLVGTLLGTFFAWGIIEVSIRDVLGAAPNISTDEGEDLFKFLFHVPFSELLLYYAIATFLALTAAFWPAVKATRLKIIEALSSRQQ